MKRVGVLTFHRAKNYGAFVQAYAFSRRLGGDFEEAQVEIVDYNTVGRVRADQRRLLGTVKRRGIRDAVKVAKQYRVFSQSLGALPRSAPMVYADHREAVDAINTNYDVVVVGSDAVFNWGDLGIPNLFFLDEVAAPVKMTYAASAHMQRYKDVDSQGAEYLNRALGKFTYLGTRDSETERFVHHFAQSVEPAHNCDPTVFLDLDEIRTPRLAEKLQRHGLGPEKPFIIFMTKDDRYTRSVRDWLGSSFQYVSVCLPNRHADVFLSDLDPFEWAKIFGHARLTITEFFHGTVLSLKNGTPVLSIDSSGFTGPQYEGKSRDLLVNRLNIPEVYFHADEFLTPQGYSRMHETLLRLLDEDYSDRIHAALMSEARAYDGFASALSRVLDS